MGQFLSAIQTRTEGLKDFLLKCAKKSREIDEYQGEYQGMIHFERLFGAITDQVNFWKNSLFKKEKGGDVGTRNANDPAPDLLPPGLPAPEDVDYDDYDGDAEPIDGEGEGSDPDVVM